MNSSLAHTNIATPRSVLPTLGGIFERRLRPVISRTGTDEEPIFGEELTGIPLPLPPPCEVQHNDI